MSAPPPNRGGMRSFVEVGCDIPLLGPHGVALVPIYPCGKARKQLRRRVAAAGASSIVVTAYMVRVSMSCGICTIPICSCSETRPVYPPTALHGRTG